METTALKKLRAGIAGPTVNMLPMWVGAAEGLFSKYGLDVEIVDTRGGSNGVAALRAGDLDVMNVGLSAVIHADDEGADLRLIAASANTMSFGFFAAAGTRNAADLAGARVGISTFGSESDVAATLALRKLGLARKDVTLVEIGATERRLEALLTGEIAATPLNEPVNLMAQRHGMRQLADLAEDVPWIFNGVVVRRADLAVRRETLANFLRAYAEAIHFALANSGRTEAVLAERFPTLDAAMARTTIDDFKRRIPRDAAPSLAGAQNMLRELPRLGVAVNATGAAALVDAGIIEALRSDGFFDGLGRAYGTG